MSPEELVEFYAEPDPGQPNPALDGLDRIDWSMLEHAYGPAVDVPPLLRALASDNAEHSEFACMLLTNNIWHQYSVFAATTAAVTFLYRLLEADETPDKTYVELILSSIAVASPDWNEHHRAAHRAVREQFDVLYSFLGDPVPEVRYWVAAATVAFPDLAARLVPSLRAALAHEPDDHVRNSLEKAIFNATNPDHPISPE